MSDLPEPETRPETQTPLPERIRDVARTVYVRTRLNRVDWSRLNWRKVALYTAGTGASLVALAVAAGLGINTGPGRQLLVDVLNGIKLDSGLKVRIGAIDGSIYGDMTLRDVTVSDAYGLVATSPKIHVDWRPMAYFNKHVDIRDLSTPRIDILRQPNLKPSAQPTQQGSLLPDLRIDLNRLQADAIVFHPGVAGADTRTLTLSGTAHLVQKRVVATLNGLSDKGDELSLRLDALPDANRLNLAAHLSAPDNGVVAELSGLKRRIRVTLDGDGTWTHWQGGLKASLDDDSLADLKISADNGRFRVAGPTRPDLILDGESAALLAPDVRIDLDATLQKRRLDTNLALDSQVASIRAKGLLDLAYNRFGHLEVHVRLLEPQRVDKSFSGKDLRADLRFDGAFATPRIDYDIQATRFGLGDIVLSGLDAQGKSHVERDGRIIVPVNARLDGFKGLGDTVDPLLQALRLDGDLVLEHDVLSSDNLHVKSSRAEARASLNGNLASGALTSDLKAWLKGYRIDKLGTVDLDTTARLARTRTGTLSLAGQFTAQSTQWENEGLKTFLGGNARLSGGYGLAPNGRVFLQHVSGGAPDFKLLAADGAFGPKDAILANLRAESKAYGPIEAVVTGTLNAPVAQIKAAHPGLGMEVADVVATLSTTPEGYVVKASGGSGYGPFDADTVIMAKDGPLTVDVKSGHFAGVAMAGRIQQTQAGPFSGQLSLNGSGLTGTAALMADGHDQAASINAVGTDVALPGDMKIAIGRTIISARAVLRKEIAVDGDVQFADVTNGGFTLSTGRAKVALRGENGTVQAVAHGQKGIPFDLAVNGQIAPNLYTVAVKGKVQGAEFHLAHPARIHQLGQSFTLEPATVVSDNGKLDIAGTYGGGYRVQARLDNFDLTLVNVFAPDAGISGRADGAVDFTQSGGQYPTAHANLKITNFTRSSAAVVSTPVDLVIDGALDPSLSPQKNYARAVVREGAAVVGRMQIALSPAGGGDWMRDIQTAGVSGGIRYNGPAAVLFSLSGQGGQQLNGPIAVAADVSGRLDAPQLSGLVKARSLVYDNDSFGTRVSNLMLDGHFNNDKLELTSFSGTAGSGTVKGSGWLSLSAADKFPLQLHVDLRDAHLARSDQVDSTVSGTLDLTNSKADGAWIKGDLRLPTLRYTVIRQGAAEVNQLDGVRHKGYRPVTTDVADDGPAPRLWNLDIRARADNQVFISGMGLDSEWRMNLHMVGTTLDPRVEGEMESVRGYYDFAGREFDIDTGTIRFNGGALTDPEINLSASGTVKDVTGIITVSGSAQRPDISFSSTPSLPQDEVLSRMLFGESVTNLSATEALQLASAVNGLRGGHDYLNPLGALRSATGIDRLRVVGADTTTGRGTSLAAGKYLTNNVYVEIVTDTKGFAATQVEVALSRALSVLSQVGNTGTAVSVKYSKDY
ncbi:translocation/assembly module TamB domain-containing protein [Asticcacaulis solisilvae]|uniref:translocation/assembly module TamB domain-containing protein n=1 Tax=Asticcacaulis solisilvae TaxID=1217274 RepID=UPI003FD854F7